jgi:hypothetical protein
MTQLKNDQVQMGKDLVELRSEVEKFITLGDLKQVGPRGSPCNSLLVRWTPRWFNSHTMTLHLYALLAV